MLGQPGPRLISTPSRSQDPAKEKLGKVIAYRHWTNCTDEWKYTPPSYMMARRLVKRFVCACVYEDIMGI